MADPKNAIPAVQRLFGGPPHAIPALRKLFGGPPHAIPAVRKRFGGPPYAIPAVRKRFGGPSFVHVTLRGDKHGAEVRPRPDLLSPEQLKPIARPPNEMVFAYGVRRRFLVADLKRAVVSELYALVPSLFEEGADLLPIEESLSPLETAWHTVMDALRGEELRAGDVRPFGAPTRSP